MTAAGRGAPARAGRRPAWARVPLLALGFVALVAGVAGGLARLGWPLPPAAAAMAALHGPLLLCGFFGVVIALERAVALGRPWAYLGPLLTGLGSAALLLGADGWAPALYAAGAAVLLAASLALLDRQREPFMLTLALAALCWACGNLLWAGGRPPEALLGWALAFLVLTIAGERLELSRLMPPSAAARRLFAALVLPIVAVLPFWPAHWAPRVTGVALVLLAGWLLRNDVARRTVRQRGLTRFVAVCLLSGYAWLAVAGAVMAVAGLQRGTPAFDAALHALLLGFVFAMVFGHAPIVFPAVLRAPMAYHPGFYAPLVLLHASLVLRLAGDAAAAFALRRWGGLLSAVALLAFVAGSAIAVARGRRR